MLNIAAMGRRAYYPQLDGLRAIAIMLVILFHWLPETPIVSMFSFGPLGVTLFFVLSGFLITNILLEEKTRIASMGFARIYFNFTYRRMLRIFPVYYFVLLCVWTARYIPSLPEIDTLLYDHIGYYLGYSSNFLIHQYGDWSDVLSIFWSLAVEEQFYLLWPFVILFVPFRHVKTAIIVAILLGMIARILLIPGNINAGVLMPTCLDSFALGGLWSVLRFENNHYQIMNRLKWFSLIGFMGYVALCFVNDESFFKILFFKTSISLIGLYFISTATTGNGFQFAFGKFLDAFWVRFMGKISYGLYIYHMLVPQFILPTILKTIRYFSGRDLALSPGLYRVVSLFILLFVATLSWYLIEQPVRALKSRSRSLVVTG